MRDHGVGQPRLALANRGDCNPMILEVGNDSPWLVRSGAALILSLHITAGFVGIASGAVALIARKGSPLHRRAGNWFFVSMLAMSAIGAIVSPFLPRPNWGNVVGGIFTFYLVATSWVTVRRADGGGGSAAIGAFLTALVVVATDLTLGIRAANAAPGALDGTPLPAYFVFATAAALAAAGDLRVFLGRGVQGTARITRHLWRMCVALLIAAFSFFLGQPQVFPKFLQGSPLLFLPEIAIVGSLVFWLIRVRFVKSGAPAAASQVALAREPR